MKITLLITLAALSASLAYAKTWTSADGEKTFEGDYVSHTEEHVIIQRGGSKIKVKLDLLSEADNKWVSEQKPAETDNKSDLGKIGSKIAENAVILDDGKYVDFEAKKSPEYYLIYFSASW